MNEEWLGGGDCGVCRRQKYCTKQCSAWKRMVQRTIQESKQQQRIAKLAALVEGDKSD